MSRLMKVAFVIAAIALPIFFFWKDIKALVGPSSKAAMVQVKDKKEKNKNEGTSDITILNKWDMPGELLEISGMAWMSENQFACIQDEDGVIFIYNTATNTIENKIPFGEPGDYEAITIKDNTAFIMRADGKIFEVSGFTSSNPSVKQYHTHLTQTHDVEGLTFDQQNNRLLAAIKGNEPGNINYKGIYAFDLNTKQMEKNPVFKINFDDEVFTGKNAKKKNKAIEPSEIAVHPITNEIYITDADQKLLILNSNGDIKGLYNMAGKEFSQAEGIAFSPDGKMFISNEGKKGSGNILEVSLDTP